MEWADRILAIDAMKAGGPPGTLYFSPVFETEDRTPQSSLHELDLLAALRFLPDRRKNEIMILGVEPKIIDSGVELSPEIQKMLPRLVRGLKYMPTQWFFIPPLHENPGDLAKKDSPEKAGVPLLG